MTDNTYHGGRSALPARKMASLAHWAGAAISLTLIVGVGVWGYRLIARDVSGVPVVQAMEGPMRIAPEDPGGTLADHQGLSVNAVAGTGFAAPPPDRLVLAPAPAGLSEEDVALGALVPEAEPAPIPAALSAPVDEAAPVLAETAEDDPLRALVAHLTADSGTLSDLDPGEDQPVVTALAGSAVEALPPSLSEATGLTRSLRPQSRPEGLRVASLGSVAESVALASPETTATEVDSDSLASGTRLVQIGAFDSPETARAEWDRLAGRFGDYLDGKSRVIQRATSGGRTFYRLRAHGFTDLSDARRFCAAFVAGGVDCIPVVAR